jgi:hypothetical protein
MNVMYREIFWGYLGIVVGVCTCYGYIAATESVGPRKGRAKLIATLAFLSLLYVPLLSLTLLEWSLPVFEFGGTITSVHVQDSSSRHYSAYLEIATTKGGEVRVHVSNPSDAWHTGQRLRVRYYGDTGELIRATLFGSDGKQTGVVNLTAGFGRTVLVLMGLVLSWFAWRRFYRDHEGAIETPEQSSGLSDAVDEESMLHLSSRDDEA